ncbi:tyrosine-type recombinase/integrase [Thalassotalea castellviae]|uniref:tyrosine-type recombinase/integrase n=1 Tax=Thalassotalea castellviae TaxID=3075612 RepID=UPI003D77CF61
MRRVIENAGIEDFRLHGFYHTCASRLVQNGMMVQETAHILVLSNIASTLCYGHLEKNQVAEKMKAVIDQFNE